MSAETGQSYRELAELGWEALDITSSTFSDVEHSDMIWTQPRLQVRGPMTAIDDQLAQMGD